MEREVAFTRSGIGGMRQVQVRRMVVTAFTHRDSRAGDPDLHTHVAVSNKVQTLPEEGGRWLALDGRVLFKAKVAASERYNTRLEAELVERLGVRFVERGTAADRRPVRPVVSESRATWQVWHVRAEAERQARAAGVRRGELDDVVDHVVARGLEVCSHRLDPVDLIEEPAALHRLDGKSVYEVAGSATYTSDRIVAAEQQILTAAQQTDGWRVRGDVAASVLARLREDLIELSVDQQDLVRELARSGRRVQLALAAAGSGKTTAMLALDRVCQAAGGNVVGLAPSAAAAAELGRATDLPTETLAKLVHTVRQVPQEEWPSWMREVGPRTLLVVDEAGMASTADLAAAVSFALSRGASVRLVGDDHQLTSVVAGGVLRDLDHHVGAVRLSHLHRFSDPAESAATLALRSGDVAALGFYADHGRIHVGDLAAATEQAYAALSADRAAGHHSLLLAPTRDLVRELNERARRDRLAGTGSDAGPVVTLGEGTRASRGDLIITRHNER